MHKLASGSSLLLKVLNKRKAQGILKPEDMLKAKRIVDAATKRRMAGGNMKRFADSAKAQKAIVKEIRNG